ncbi:unnamed protein product [Closterium sp. NIES-65]|nr:unnamed protein product [Closterium sp. NIES-65]
MTTPNVLTFDAEGRAVDFEVWVDDLQLFLQSDRKDGLSLFDLTSGVSTAPAANADSTVRSQWTTRDAAARLAMRSHLPSSEHAHFSQYKSAETLYDVVVARYSSPATAALSCLMLPYLFPDLAAFATVADLITHLRTSDTRYRTALPAEDHFLSICPTKLIVDLIEERLLAAEKSIVAVGASRGDSRAPFFEGCSPSRLLPSVASAAAVNLVGTESRQQQQRARETPPPQQRARETPPPQQLHEWYAARQRGGGAGPCAYVLRTGDRTAAALGAGEAAALRASAFAAPGAGESAAPGAGESALSITTSA